MQIKRFKSLCTLNSHETAPAIKGMISRKRDTDMSENKYMDTKGKGSGWKELGDWDQHMYTVDTLCEIGN